MVRDGRISARTARVSGAIEAAFGVKAPTLQRAARKAGRRLPRRVRANVALLTEAEARAQNPRLAATLDHTALARAEEDTLAWLATIDRADARRGALLNLAGAIVFKLLVVGAGFVAWLVWSGHL